MSKRALQFMFYAPSLSAVVILVMSMGWMLFIFGIFILPVVVVHFVAGIKELKRPLIRSRLLALSSFNFLLVCLLRPDGDDQNSYTGYSALMYHLGMLDKPYMDTWDALLYLTILMFLFQLGVDLLLLLRRSLPGQTEMDSDFV